MASLKLRWIDEGAIFWKMLAFNLTIRLTMLKNALWLDFAIGLRKLIARTSNREF